MNVNKVSLFTAAQTSASKAQSPSFGKWDMKSHDYFIKNDDGAVGPELHPQKQLPGGSCSIMLTAGDDICKAGDRIYCTHAALRLLRDTDDIVITMGPKKKPVADINEKAILEKIKLRTGVSWKDFAYDSLKKSCKEGMSSRDLRNLANLYYDGFYAPLRDEPLRGPDLEKEEPPGMWNIGLD